MEALVFIRMTASKSLAAKMVFAFLALYIVPISSIDTGMDRVLVFIAGSIFEAYSSCVVRLTTAFRHIYDRTLYAYRAIEFDGEPGCIVTRSR